MAFNRATVDAWAAENGLTLSDERIGPGDLYVAQRNGDPVLLECNHIDPRGWVVPQKTGYPYDIHECVKVQP